ncbi:unnamed protein product [Adineta steineri]|uniref:Uncharacterized protein n=1 Tax=Adineta steineri TaxID=433720 RepID=A0A814I2A5_9BILA|nr:unnamed protein product [Adineta steineri]CAF1011732.1 unnamed protein product [Adineta steineri]CAF1017846.1 unnamed protein product [Adineta steineri]CAF3740651.1 unnamed protein product [Adineta steineri]CAF3824623.1 unnamed protein product [Adineta steineri]
MQVYHYCLFLLAFIAVLINSRYIDRSYDNEHDDELYFPSNYHLERVYRSRALDRYIRNMLANNNNDDEKSNESAAFERRGKSITKGDPREFMG